MSHCNCTKRIARFSRIASHRSALTLLELVVVLGILALLAGVAVQSLDPIANQSRYEATQTLLNTTRTAITGDPLAMTVNNQRIVSGYIADTGLLPTTISDLMTRPNSVVSFGSQSFDSDRDTIDDIHLTRGWNGPYLNLGAGRSSVLDGWGHALDFQNNAGELSITSLGSDNDSLAPETGYQADMIVTVPTNAYTGEVVFHLYAISTITGSRVEATQANLLDGISSPPPDTKRMGVLVYAKNAAGGNSGAIEELFCPVPMSGIFEFRISGAIQGRAAARAIFWADADNDLLPGVGETILRKSCVHTFDIVPAYENQFSMELR